MKPKISASQLAFLIANFIFVGTLVSLPQVLVQVAEHNTWMVPLFAFPFILLFLYIGFGKTKKLTALQSVFTKGKLDTKLQKAFIMVLCVFILLGIIRDLRALTEFVTASLLPQTPIEALVVAAVLAISYVSTAGLEVIARVTAIQFIVLGAVILSLPFMLLNEIDYYNLQPVFGSGAFTSIGRSVFLYLSWLLEIVIVFFLAGFTEPITSVRKAGFIGACLSTVLLFILIFMEIAVLGSDLVKLSTFPNYLLIQEINITDFLDRLDLVIVTLWAPTLFAKLSLALYMLNKGVSLLRGTESNILTLPIGMLLGVLSIVLFKNNVQHLSFSFFTWAILGLCLELFLFLLFFMIRKKAQKRAKSIGN